MQDGDGHTAVHSAHASASILLRSSLLRTTSLKNCFSPLFRFGLISRTRMLELRTKGSKHDG